MGGPGITTVATRMAAFMQCQSFAMALLVAGASLAIATLVGTLVTAWMTGGIAHLNWGLIRLMASAPQRTHRSACG
jgi:predicted PurR-regulated permease PerM